MEYGKNMEQEDVFEPITSEIGSEETQLETSASFVVDQTVKREPYTGIWTDPEVEE
jgi:hypothetical protein